MTTQEQEDDDRALVEADQEEKLALALRARLRVDPNALDEEFVACPADIAYLGALHARAIGDQLRAKGRAKRVRAFVRIEKRKALIAANGKTTVDEVDAEVELDARVEAADEDEIVAEVELTTAKANFAAVMAKKDMIVQMGATMRAEMERDPVIVRDRREARQHGGG